MGIVDYKINNNETVSLFIERKKTQKEIVECLIDEEDFDLVGGMDWNAIYNSSIDGYYAVTKTGVFMHRLIMSPPKKLVVDHINHNTMDNRKSNLRVVSRSINNKNRRRVLCSIDIMDILSDKVSSLSILAKKYGTTEECIADIKNGKTYKDLYVFFNYAMEAYYVLSYMEKKKK